MQSRGHAKEESRHALTAVPTGGSVGRAALGQSETLGPMVAGGE